MSQDALFSDEIRGAHMSRIRYLALVNGQVLIVDRSRPYYERALAVPVIIVPEDHVRIPAPLSWYKGLSWNSRNTPFDFHSRSTHIGSACPFDSTEPPPPVLHRLPAAAAGAGYEQEQRHLLIWWNVRRFEPATQESDKQGRLKNRGG